LIHSNHSFPDSFFMHKKHVVSLILFFLPFENARFCGFSS
jgi:hypothetical protein